MLACLLEGRPPKTNPAATALVRRLGARPVWSGSDICRASSLQSWTSRPLTPASSAPRSTRRSAMWASSSCATTASMRRSYSACGPSARHFTRSRSRPSCRWRRSSARPSWATSTAESRPDLRTPSHYRVPGQPATNGRRRRRTWSASARRAWPLPPRSTASVTACCRCWSARWRCPRVRSPTHLQRLRATSTCGTIPTRGRKQSACAACGHPSRRLEL